VPRQSLGADLETNIRLVTSAADGVVTCRRVEIRSAVWSDDLRATVCSILRRRHGLIAVPSRFDRREILVVAQDAVEAKTIQHKPWRADLTDTGKIARLSFEREADQSVIADLIEKSLVVAFERDPNYWRLLTSSARYWYSQSPQESVDGIQAIAKLSFATLPMGQRGIGIAFHTGFLYRSELTVADFFDPSQSKCDAMALQGRFDNLRSKHDGRKGTLLYDTGQGDVSVCYFERFAVGVTCESTGPIMGRESLLEYCRKRYPKLGLKADDSVAYVSFRGLPHEVPVAAKLLRLRIHLDKRQVPYKLQRTTTSPPEHRRRQAIEVWRNCDKRPFSSTQCQASKRLWRPAAGEHELLICPDLLFGKGRIVAAPRNPTVTEYKRYYRQRMEALRDGGFYHYNQSVERAINIVTPTARSGWSDEIQYAFVRDFVDCMANFTDLTFRVQEVRADGSDEILDRLKGHHPGTAVIVFDGKHSDPATYCLLSHGLAGWNIKRLTRATVEERFRAKMRPGSDEQHQKAIRNWHSVIDLSVLDTLDQMGATPWRLAHFPYEACLTIDVGQDRRYFAISLLICRDEAKRPSFLRVTRTWPKPDHRREEINAELLRDKIVEVFEEYRASSFSPVATLLGLRDGHQCGNEFQGISQAINLLQKRGRLMQGAKVDLVDVHKQSVKNLRMWYPIQPQCSNVLEGHAIYPDQHMSLVSCTGAATVPPGATADPCMLVSRDGVDIRRPTQAFFALSQLNFSTPGKAHRYAQPLRETDAQLQHRMNQDMRGIK
jgi:hypothetical protein